MLNELVVGAIKGKRRIDLTFGIDPCKTWTRIRFIAKKHDSRSIKGL